MSTKTKEDSKPAPKTEIASDADADLDHATGPVEGILLSKPCKRMVLKGNQLNEHTFWNIVVFNLSEKDNDKTSASTLESEGEMVCRIKKAKHPSFMFGNKLNVFADLISEQEPEAQTGMTQAAIEHQKNNMIVVDVHFPRAVHKCVRQVSKTHCELCRSTFECSKCNMKDVIEMPNVVVCEVEEIDMIETANTTARGQTKAAEMSE